MVKHGMGTMAPDFVDLLQAFAAADVRYLVVGARRAIWTFGSTQTLRMPSV